jgi:hypothetical protein
MIDILVALPAMGLHCANRESGHPGATTGGAEVLQPLAVAA